MTAAGGPATSHRDLIVTLAARHKLPAVYYDRFFVVPADGLVSYGPDRIDLFRRAAGYVHRILKGAVPADLPIQRPVLFVLTINAGTAKTLGMTLPHSLILRADQLIEA